jgi:arginine decarboxylase
LRGDAWCRLEEASDRLTKPTISGELREEYVTICRDLLATLTPLEPYWAYPGTPQF